MLNWVNVFSAVDVALSGVQNAAGGTAFTDVIRGEPIALPLGGPYACFWYDGREDARAAAGARKTFGNVMYAAVLRIACLWPIRAERSTWGSWEADIATIDTNIRRAFRADSTINSNVTDLEIGDSTLTYGYLPFPGGEAARGLYRILEMELVLDNLEGEAIAP